LGRELGLCALQLAVFVHYSEEAKMEGNVEDGALSLENLEIALFDDDDCIEMPPSPRLIPAIKLTHVKYKKDEKFQLELILLLIIHNYSTKCIEGKSLSSNHAFSK
jgi:hypothetical protein